MHVEGREQALRLDKSMRGGTFQPAHPLGPAVRDAGAFKIQLADTQFRLGQARTRRTSE